MDAQCLDEDGYLINPLDWDESWAEHFARQENIALTDDHWDVIRFMRSYYEAHLIAPDARYSIKHLAERFGAEARNKLFELFPYGYVQQACRIAGMKRPRNWSTG
ncbi:MAG: TusE/DsrC/DsvC family sulfur relay protein [Betaproteobacteria bacterium]|nr:TusE/DsrC/DsvC family sulfur relay protein [Betaproteobacteria bacterium]